MPAAARRPARPGSRYVVAPRERAIGVFLFLVMVAGSIVLWVGVPLGALFVAGKLLDNPGYHFPLALAIVIPSLVGGASLLAWVNALYLSVVEAGEERAQGRGIVRRRGPLEPILAVTFGIAAVAMTIWFFVFAENPGPVF